MFGANNIIKFIGLGLIGIGYYYFIGSIRLEEYKIFCFSISAFLFVISDFCDFKQTQKEEQIIKNKYSINFWYYFKNTSLLLAILFITLIPYFHPEFSEQFIAKLNNTSLLIGLGITIMLIGFRSDKKVIDTLNKIGKRMEDILRKTNK